MSTTSRNSSAAYSGLIGSGLNVLCSNGAHFSIRELSSTYYYSQSVFLTHAQKNAGHGTSMRQLLTYVMLSSVMALTKMVMGGAMDLSDVRA